MAKLKNKKNHLLKKENLSAIEIKEYNQHSLALSFSEHCKGVQVIESGSNIKYGSATLLGKNGKPKTKPTSITRAGIKHYFKSFNTFVEFAALEYPDNFKGVVNRLNSLKNRCDLPFSVEKLSSLTDILGVDYKRVLVTSATGGRTINDKFIKSLQNYCKRNNAVCLVVEQGELTEKDRLKLRSEKYIHLTSGGISLNTKVGVSASAASPTHFNPTSSFERACSRQDSSLIVASPKQCMRVVARQKGCDPYVILTTGSCVKPFYPGGKRNGINRKETIALHDHIVGGLIVELVNENKFHFRPFQAAKDGSFIDLSVKYLPNGKTKKTKALAISLGDFHSIEKNEIAVKATIEDLAKTVGAKEAIVHDFFDGKSISHHTEIRVALRSAHQILGVRSLASEFKVAQEDLDYLSDHFEKVVMVPSNHDEFVDRLLDRAQWVSDTQNNFLSAMLFPYAVFQKLVAELSGDVNEAIKLTANYHSMTKEEFLKAFPNIEKSPLEKGLEFFSVKNPKKIQWLKRDESYVLAGCELGQHGDKGAHGSRGSARGLEKSLGVAIIGHSHTPCWNNGIMQNGTLSRKDPLYATGPSGWMHSSTILYEDGSRQMINVHDDGSWRI